MTMQHGARVWVALTLPLLTAMILGQSAAAGDDPCPTCLEIATQVLAGPHMPEVLLGESRVLGGGDSPLPTRTQFLLEDAESRDRGELCINHETHLPVSLKVTRPPGSERVVTVSWTDALRNAREAAEYLVADFCTDQPPKLGLTLVEPVERTGTLRLVFRIPRQVGQTTFWSPNVVSVGIAVDTGEVIGLGNGGSRQRWPHSFVAPSERVLEECLTAVAAALKMPAETLRSDRNGAVYVGSWDSDSPHAEWRLTFLPAHAFESALLPPQWAQVSLTEHEVLRVSTIERPAWLEGRVMRTSLDDSPWEEAGADFLQPTHGVDDRWPVWSADGESLFILSKRPRPGAPWWRRVPSVVAVNLGNGLLECVHAPLEGTLRALSVAGSVIVANNANRHEAQIRNLRDGTYFAQGHYPDAHFDNPSVSADGGAIVYSADRRHGDTDIFVDDIKPDFDGLMGHRRLCKLEGTDHHPVFVGDGKRVCFAHVEWVTHAAGETPPPPASSLYVVNAGAPYWENDPPVRVVEGFTKVHQLSTFLDGQRVLVADEAGLWIVDVETWAKTELNLPELHDPDLPDGPALKLRQPAVSPDGTRLVFSGYRDSGEDAEGTGWYIYVCDLDGSNLRRVTPLEDEPIPAYVFPETGKTAFDVAREIALERAERPE